MMVYTLSQYSDTHLNVFTLCRILTESKSFHVYWV